MSNVVSLVERREAWHVAFRRGDLVVQVSNHGRIRVSTGGPGETMSFCDSVGFLKEINEDFDRTMSPCTKARTDTIL